MTHIDLRTSVGELVTKKPRFFRIFEDLKIDYCCHGNMQLRDACQQRELDPNQVLQILNRSEDPEPNARNWGEAPLTELCEHIVQTHHAYLRRELPRLEQLTAKVAEVHGDLHPELNGVKAVFQALQAELIPHMMKEEQILFPAVRQLEDSSQPLNLPFGTVQNPIRMMEHEHDAAGGALRKLNELTNGYHIPEDACNTYRTMLQGLKELELELELDLHQHIHKENNILFLRAIKLEEALCC